MIRLIVVAFVGWISLSIEVYADMLTVIDLGATFRPKAVNSSGMLVGHRFQAIELIAKTTNCFWHAVGLLHKAYNSPVAEAYYALNRLSK